MPGRAGRPFLLSSPHTSDAGRSGIAVRCTLAIENVVVFVVQGGPPDVEYALFEAGESELRASEPGTIREAGYRTSAGALPARGSTTRASPPPSRTAPPSAGPGPRSCARTLAARPPGASSPASEASEVLGVARVRRGHPAATPGRGLDLTALATDTWAWRGRGGAAARALPRRLPRGAPGGLARGARHVGARGPATRRRAHVPARRPRGRPGGGGRARGAQARPRSLDAGGHRAGQGAGHRVGSGHAPSGTPAARASGSEAIEASLGTREPPTRGPLAETAALGNVEAKLSRGEPAGMLDQIDAIERRRGRVPGTMYLRARIALMTGTEDARSVAERVAALSGSMAAPFPELELLAAQAWAAAGDARRARAFARDLQDNATADDGLRLQAVELLDSIGGASSVGAGRQRQGLVPRGAGSSSPSRSSACIRFCQRAGVASRARDARRRGRPQPSRTSRSRGHPALRPARRLDSPRPRAGSRRARGPAFPPPRPTRPERHRDAPLAASGDVAAAVPHRAARRALVVLAPSRRFGARARRDAPAARGPQRHAPLPTDELPRNPPAARVMCTFCSRGSSRGSLRLQALGRALRSDVDGHGDRAAVPEGAARRRTRAHGGGAPRGAAKRRVPRGAAGAPPGGAVGGPRLEGARPLGHARPVALATGGSRPRLALRARPALRRHGPPGARPRGVLPRQLEARSR